MCGYLFESENKNRWIFCNKRSNLDRSHLLLKKGVINLSFSVHLSSVNYDLNR